MIKKKDKLPESVKDYFFISLLLTPRLFIKEDGTKEIRYFPPSNGDNKVELF